ncbi:MAG: hypothetical protein ACR2JW_19180 [Thermomicrobiales bacterium]
MTIGLAGLGVPAPRASAWALTPTLVDRCGREGVRVPRRVDRRSRQRSPAPDCRIPYGRGAGSGLGADPPVVPVGRAAGSGFGGPPAGPGGRGGGSGFTTALVRVNVTAVAPGALAVTV